MLTVQYRFFSYEARLGIPAHEGQLPETLHILDAHEIYPLNQWQEDLTIEEH